MVLRVNDFAALTATDEYQAALTAFRAAHPAYDCTGRLDELRMHEYARLDAQGHVYLDYTGGALYADCQVRAHLDLLRGGVFGNPHSDNPTSRVATNLAEEARAAVLAYFNAAPDEYTAVFTANATAALKLIGEAYPFAPGGQFLLTTDNHNSVNGMREFARTKGANTRYVPVIAPELRVDEGRLMNLLDDVEPGGGLFAYPAQSNFSGVQHPLTWVSEARARGWDVLLDAAAFAPTNRLDLSQYQPDFVSLSFYKIFGYPTGVGCLLARRAALQRLRRPWFAGGTVIAATALGDSHYLAEGAAGLEDGTINYLSLPAVTIDLRYLATIGVETIHERVQCLTAWLIAALTALRHANGAPLVRVYGPMDDRRRGATLGLNLLDPLGRVVDVRLVERRAWDWNMSLRTGCFCNPGAAEAALAIERESIVASFAGAAPESFDQLLATLGVVGGGAVRVSLGLATNFADVYRFVRFAQTSLDQVADAHDLPARRHC
ncbi:MAG TPA: aminotransferase class V-fold PLP-dependent enzyme [Roseiflexaceae bacterium]|nr:aminotransferase class V-fold PLP-dependent enzyme [Roseiflexaceae bacterium]